jgi:hypothetical protein
MRPWRPSKGEIRPSDEAVTEGLGRIEKAAEEELKWFFATTGEVREEGEPPEEREAARTIRGCLDRLLTFHVGALALRFTPRRWSAVLDAQYGEWASLVVRMDCAANPSDEPRSVEGCEADAAVRLEAAIVRNRDGKERARLLRHSKQHVRAALRAYVRCREQVTDCARAREGGPR